MKSQKKRIIYGILEIICEILFTLFALAIGFFIFRSCGAESENIDYDLATLVGCGIILLVIIIIYIVVNLFKKR